VLNHKGDFMKTIGLFFLFFLSACIASAQQLPLDNQPITSNVKELYTTLMVEEIKSEYETKQEYIDRVKKFYQNQPIYFFKRSCWKDYDAETQTLRISLDTSEKHSSSSTSNNYSDYFITLLNLDDFCEPNEEILNWNPGRKVVFKKQISPEKAEEMGRLNATVGIVFNYPYTTEDFGNSNDSVPAGLVFRASHEFARRDDGTAFSYSDHYIRCVLKSITICSKDEHYNNVIYEQKHTFSDDSPVWNYTTATEEPKESSGSGGGGGCFISILE